MNISKSFYIRITAKCFFISLHTWILSLRKTCTDINSPTTSYVSRNKNRSWKKWQGIKRIQFYYQLWHRSFFFVSSLSVFRVCWTKLVEIIIEIFIVIIRVVNTVILYLLHLSFSASFFYLLLLLFIFFFYFYPSSSIFTLLLLFFTLFFYFWHPAIFMCIRRCIYSLIYLSICVILFCENKNKLKVKLHLSMITNNKNAKRYQGK
jgi:hypothetical protein